MTSHLQAAAAPPHNLRVVEGVGRYSESIRGHVSTVGSDREGEYLAGFMVRGAAAPKEAQLTGPALKLVVESAAPHRIVGVHAYGEDACELIHFGTTLVQASALLSASTSARFSAVFGASSIALLGVHSIALLRVLLSAVLSASALPSTCSFALRRPLSAGRQVLGRRDRGLLRRRHVPRALQACGARRDHHAAEPGVAEHLQAAGRDG